MPDPDASENLRLRFRPRGAGRFLSAGFLTVWLCGWAVGEGFALLLLGNGIYALVTGSPAMGSAEPIRLGPALAVGAFLVVWLTIWTIGGVMAFRELLRTVWAEDRLVLGRESLLRRHRLGLWVSTQAWSRAEIRRVFVQSISSRPGALMAQVGAGVTELTDLGTPEERRAAADTLRAALGLPEDDAHAGLAALPEDWQETTDPRGQTLLVPNVRTRRVQALAVTLIAGIAWAFAALLAWESRRSPTLWVLTLMVAVLAAWLWRQAGWLRRGRNEWRIERGKLVQQRRAGTAITELAEARALELNESTDSDGDRWYELRAVEMGAPAYTLRPRARKIPQHIPIQCKLHDATEPRSLGLWLAQRAAIPFRDRVPTEASRQAEFARVREQLAGAGRFGRVVARLLDRLNDRADKR